MVTRGALIAVGGCVAVLVAAVPAVIGLTGNTSFSHEIPVRVPAGASVLNVGGAPAPVVLPAATVSSTSVAPSSLPESSSSPDRRPDDGYPRSSGSFGSSGSPRSSVDRQRGRPSSSAGPTRSRSAPASPAPSGAAATSDRRRHGGSGGSSGSGREGDG